jgi:hypothetical protein
MSRASADEHKPERATGFFPARNVIAVPAHHRWNNRWPNPKGMVPPLAQDEVLGNTTSAGMSRL